MSHRARLERLERARQRQQEQVETTWWVHYAHETEATGQNGERCPVADLPPGARRVVIEYADDWRGVSSL